jgi:hypothetical protein
MAFLTRSALLALAGMAFALGAGEAQAYPDAQVDQQIRPSFGVLLQPPVKHRYRPRAWTPGRYGPGSGGGGYGHGPRRSRQLDSMTVDCSGPNGPSLNDAVFDLRDQGVLYIRSGGACVDTLEVTHPIVIVGESLPSFARGPAAARARLTAPAGQSCIRIAPGVKGVVIRDLVIDGSQSGQSACIEAVDAELAMDRTRVNYNGDASAIYMQGGVLVMSSSTVDARTNDAALTLEGTQVTIDRTRIVADVRGIDITPAPGVSTLNQVGLLGQGSNIPGATGITLRDQRSGSGTLVVTNAVFRNWVTAVYVDRGGKLEIANSRILKTHRGIASDWGTVSLRRSVVHTDSQVAVFAGGGARPVLEYNRYIGGNMTFEGGITADTKPSWVYQGNCNGGPFGPAVYCRLAGDFPYGVYDETGFEEDVDGWNVDGYQMGFLRDGQPTPCRLMAPPPSNKKPPKRRKKGPPPPPTPVYPVACQQGY